MSRTPCATRSTLNSPFHLEEKKQREAGGLRVLMTRERKGELEREEERKRGICRFCSIDLRIVDKRDLGVQVKVFSFSLSGADKSGHFTSRRAILREGDKSEFAKVNNKGV
jgi:hypothetical protein